MSNIFEPISDDAYKQIEVRQTKISQEFRDNETIAWLNSNGAFVRLKSSIDVISGSLRPGYEGDNPAQFASRFTLHGGIGGGDTYTPADEKLSYSQQSGIFSETNNNPVYGYGGSSEHVGLKPMPGIEKVSVKTVGEGYLREATINLRVNTPEHLNLLDILYFRPGYSVLLEWGHTAYFTNDKIYENNPYREISLRAEYKKETILDLIEKNRKESSYNYDAMFAVIENFQWSFRDDGGYDVTLKLISTGDIVDSLKISGVSNSINPPEGSENQEDPNVPPIVKEYNKSKLHQNLIPILLSEGGSYYIGQTGTSTVTVRNPSDIGYRGGSQTTTTTIIETKTIDQNSIVDEVLTPGWFGKETKKSTYKQWSLKSYELPLNFSDDIKNNDKHNQVIFVAKPASFIPKTNDLYKTTTEEIKSNCYIKFRALLDLINNLYFIKDYHPISNPSTGSIDMYVPKFTISTDPEVCIIDSTSLTDLSKYLGETIEKNLNLITKMYEKSDSFFVDNKKVIGNLLDLYINVKFILSTFESNIDQEGNLTVKQFFQSILDSINSSTGGVNDFKIIENPQQGTLEIISLFNNPYKENFEELNKKKLKNFGNKTLFKSISLTSELTDDISSQIAISAQVDNTDTNGERGDIFAYFNNGIKDRIIPKKTTESSATEETTPTKEETRINNAKSLLDYLLAIYPNNFKKKFPEPSLSVSTAQRYLKELLNYFEQQNPDTRGTSVIIPVNLSFTMQGFSGFKLFNEFIIPTDFLPNLYKSSNGVDPKFKFLVKGINHDISINQWDTSIETFMAPIPEKSGYGDGESQSSSTTNSDSVGTNPTSTAGEAQTPPPPTTPEEIAPPLVEDQNLEEEFFTISLKGLRTIREDGQDKVEIEKFNGGNKTIDIKNFNRFNNNNIPEYREFTLKININKFDMSFEETNSNLYSISLRERNNPNNALSFKILINSDSNNVLSKTSP